MKFTKLSRILSLSSLVRKIRMLPLFVVGLSAIAFCSQASATQFVVSNNGDSSFLMHVKVFGQSGKDLNLPGEGLLFSGQSPTFHPNQRVEFAVGHFFVHYKGYHPYLGRVCSYFTSSQLPYHSHVAHITLSGNLSSSDTKITKSNSVEQIGQKTSRVYHWYESACPFIPMNSGSVAS